MSRLDHIYWLISQIGSAGYKDGSSVKQGYLYHPLPFPEFNVFVHKTSTVEEYNCIRNDYGSFKDATVLDIGCANGFFTFSCALENAKLVTGYEADGLVNSVNEAIKDYKQIKNVSFINKHFTIEDALTFGHRELDVIIMMNVHMWIYKQIGAEKTTQLMKTLCDKCRVMYFQTAHKSDVATGKCQVNELTSEESIRQYLLDAGFKNVKMIGQNSEWFNRFMFRCDNVEKK